MKTEWQPFRFEQDTEDRIQQTGGNQDTKPIAEKRPEQILFYLP